MEESITRDDVFAREILSYFDRPLPDIRTLSPLALAWLGDTIFDLVVRTYIVGNGSTSPDKMQKKASRLVSAKAQADMISDISEILTDEEKDYVRRGRNAKPKTKAKNASSAQYHKATGFETLIGYLYLTGQTGRCITLIKQAIDGEINEK